MKNAENIQSFFLTGFGISNGFSIKTGTKNQKDKKKLLSEKYKLAKSIVVDGKHINNNLSAVYRGLGVVTGNNSSRLLLDYRSNYPKEYKEIMRLLFEEGYGAGLSHIKIEMGADINSSSGTEPSTMRYEDEMADVTRGAGFIFASDAKKINPNITIDLLRWGQPAWVTKAFEIDKEAGFEARYKWYKETIDMAYEVFGLEFDYISADNNETLEPETDWIIYLSKSLKAEVDCCYDYSLIKIVASDEVCDKKIGAEMLKDQELLEAVDVIGLHYTTFGDDNTKKLSEEYGKEIWYSEGIAPCNNSELAFNKDGCGISGINSAIDIANRIINSYYHGNMVMYEYQPAVSSYYSGSNYSPKQLIEAVEPWSGNFKIGSGLWLSAHFTHFIKRGWKYVDGACFGDGEENHFITNTSHNYMTLASPTKNDYTMILTNDSDKPRYYKICVRNLKKADSPLYVRVTKGSDTASYYKNWFREAAKLQPTETKYGYCYLIEVEPYSIMTLSTLKVIEKAGNKRVNFSRSNPERLALPYTDDFKYTELGGERYLKKRGYAPRYTTDQGGAFEVAKEGKNYVLKQMITKDIIPTNWHFRGTPNPTTNLGDDTWANYSAEIEIKLVDNISDNYVGLGVRYNSAVTCDWSAECGYHLRLYSSGEWELKYIGDVIHKGKVENFEAFDWHSLSVSAEGKLISCSLDKRLLCQYNAAGIMINSGRVSLYSGFYNNEFSNLIVTPSANLPTYIKRIDALSNEIRYSNDWEFKTMNTFRYYNRTTAECEKAGQTFEFEFVGTGFALIGENADNNATLELELDGNIVDTIEVNKCGCRQVFYKLDNLTNIQHKVKVRLMSGKIIIDVIEVTASDTLIKHPAKIKNKNADAETKTPYKNLQKGIIAAVAISGAGLLIANQIDKKYGSNKNNKKHSIIKTILKNSVKKKLGIKKAKSKHD